jgi:hypothetical protein
MTGGYNLTRREGTTVTADNDRRGGATFDCNGGNTKTLKMSVTL